MVAAPADTEPSLVDALAPWVRKLANKLAARDETRRIDPQDLYQEGLLAVHLLAPAYDPARAKPAAFVGRRVYGAMVDYLRGRHELGVTVARRAVRTGEGPAREGLELHEPETADPEPGDDFAAAAAELCRRYRVVLDAGDLHILAAYFGTGLTMRLVGAGVGLSESRVSQRIKRVIDDLRAAMLAAGRDWRTALD